MEKTTVVEKKLTKVQKFEMLLNIPGVAENEMLVDFIKHEQELLSKKNSGEKKPTKTQQENELLKERLFEGMEVETPMTVTQIQKTVPGMEEFSNQKISALLRQMEGEGRVGKRTEKRSTLYFKIES